MLPFIDSQLLNYSFFSERISSNTHSKAAKRKSPKENKCHYETSMKRRNHFGRIKKQLETKQQNAALNKKTKKKLKEWRKKLPEKIVA